MVARASPRAGTRPVRRAAPGGWHHPNRGQIPPDQFIPLAEKNGLINELSSKLLAQAAAQLASLRTLDGYHDLQLTLNVSATQDPDRLTHEISTQLRRHSLPPTSLVLELTETSLVYDSHDTLERLHHARALGLQVAIDDFGTGSSSLRYLSQLPIDILNIAKPFIDGDDPESEEWALARMIIELAKALNLKTVAEGVQSRNQHTHLRQLDCDYAQGYHYARPLSPKQLHTHLRHHTLFAA